MLMANEPVGREVDPRSVRAEVCCHVTFIGPAADGDTSFLKSHAHSQPTPRYAGVRGVNAAEDADSSVRGHLAECTCKLAFVAGTLAASVLDLADNRCPAVG